MQLSVLALGTQAVRQGSGRKKSHHKDYTETHFSKVRQLKPSQFESSSSAACGPTLYMVRLLMHSD
jgi:hypothetical protein